MKFIRNLVIVSFFAFQLSVTANDDYKQLQWDRLEEEVSQWVDDMGHGVDGEIKEAIVALNLLGVKTTQSCGGHENYGRYCPWIDIGYDEDDYQMVHDRFIALEKEITEVTEILSKKYPDTSLEEIVETPEGKAWSENYEKLFGLRDDWVRVEQFYTAKVHVLLNEFYKERQTHYENVMVITENHSLMSLGATFQLGRTPEERAERFLGYQAEMNEFTRFLKNYYFENN